ncbi:MAG: hypothetical protein IPJ33_19540 [Gammaproteobacteria bacterium]|nr:hypothetical protein [Gammaproteobacteria bacterium]
MTLALASMTMNNLITPFYRLGARPSVPQADRDPIDTYGNHHPCRAGAPMALPLGGITPARLRQLHRFAAQFFPEYWRCSTGPRPIAPASSAVCQQGSGSGY